MVKQALLKAAKGLCDAFAQGKSVDELLSFFTEHEAVVIEHGHPYILWLGREYIGKQEIAQYFETIGSELENSGITFSDYFVDEGEF